MYIDLVDINPYAVQFSICVGISGCGFSISSNVFCTRTAYVELMKIAPNSDLAADGMNAFMISEIFRTIPLLVKKLEFLKMKWCPLTLPHDFGLLR